MVRRDVDSTVLLPDRTEAPILAAKLFPSASQVVSYDSLEDLAREESLSSIAVLVLHVRPAPRGLLLVALGWLSLEYPSMRKVAVVDGPLPLPIVTYLTACGVDLVAEDDVGGSVDRMMGDGGVLSSADRVMGRSVR